jgi:AraC-like DNA-binding protein
MDSTTSKEKAIFWHAADLGGIELLKAKFITHTFPRHIHEGYVIGVIERGAEKFYYRGATHTAPAGAVIVINPGEVHTGQAADGQGWSYRTLYPQADALKRRVAELGGPAEPPFFPTPVINDNHLAHLIRHLHRTLESSESTLERETIFMVTMAQLIRRHAADKPILPLTQAEPQAISQIRDYLEANYAENISLNQLAELVNFSPFYLNRVFRQMMGLPPYAYLTQVRITNAKRLLRLGQPLAQVALETGFVDQSHLNRHFKRFVGVTPGQYRPEIPVVTDNH